MSESQKSNCDARTLTLVAIFFFLFCYMACLYKNYTVCKKELIIKYKLNSIIFLSNHIPSNSINFYMAIQCFT